MKVPRRVIPFAGSHLDGTMHVCAFFNSADEEYGVLLPFIRDGFDCGDRAVHIVGTDRQHTHLQRLETAGIDTKTAQENGQLDLRANTETYLKDGRFDKDRMLDAFERFSRRDPSSRFPHNRIVCHMDWAADNGPHVEELIEFEALVNGVWETRDDAVICVYDLAKFTGDTIIDMMRTHPMIIVGGTLHKNPFYVPPATFLHEFRSRRGLKLSTNSSD